MDVPLMWTNKEVDSDHGMVQRNRHAQANPSSLLHTTSLGCMSTLLSSVSSIPPCFSVHHGEAARVRCAMATWQNAFADPN